ncbi:MAG: Gfo/Idh/MocA family oxidoreductase [Rheinheimera sp.]|nr:Gfo/Idh/MocA family oxidoreductase [Rheinheimera sp.]
MFRIALTGLGDIAQKAYLPLVCQHLQVKPVLCSRNTDVLRTLAQQYRVEESYSDFASMLASRPDAVMIHSSTSSHFQLATAVLEAGIALFIDKPVCDTLAQTEQLLTLAATNNLPFVVGFNRRFAPLYQAPLCCKQPAAALQSLHYQKHRHLHSAAPRQLIFDDFIHLIDLLVVAAGLTELAEINIQPHFGRDQQLLQKVRLQFTHRGRDFSAVMDRRAGASFERLEVFAKDQYWQIDNLRSGQHSAAGALQPLGFGDWVPTLTQRGFGAMLDDWLAALATGTTDLHRLQQYRLSHQIAEQLTVQAEAFLQQR